VLQKEDRKLFFVLLVAAILLFLFGMFMGLNMYFVIGEFLALVVLVRLLLK